MALNGLRRTFMVSLCGVVYGATAPALAGARTVTSAKVVSAIQRGVHFLLAHENMNPGSQKPCWETGIRRGNIPIPEVPQYGGETALVTEALLDVGQSLHLPQVNPYAKPMRTAIDFLIRLNPKTTYAASFQATAITLLPNKPAYRRVLEHDRRYLLISLHRDGAYGYAMSPRWPANPNLPDKWDNSNSQYGLLGIWACAHQGLEIPGRYWRLTAQHWRSCQYANGAWTYHLAGTHPAVANRPVPFTPAGVASLFICDEFLRQHPRLDSIPDKNILRGLAWINAHFAPSLNNVYAMYGYERVALASGLQTFGGHNWYRAFARTLLAEQKPNGSWPCNMDYNGPQDAYIGTAYALLILDRGLNPVLINKLQYTKKFYGQWSARQRDAANFTSWVSKTYEAPLNWQVVSVQSPVRDWLDSPILLITGYKDPHFTAGEIAKLRQYVEAGGLVLCSGDGGSSRFKNAMIACGKAVMENKYPVKTLSKTSFLYTMQPWYHARHTNGYVGINNGVRYVWIICEHDLGAAWQGREFSRRDDWEIPANLYFYATGKRALADRLKSLAVAMPVTPPARHLAMARVKYAGNWNAEPGAWPRMARLAAAKFQMGLAVKTVAVENLRAAQYPLAEMTGTGDFHFTAKQVAALRAYLHHGGMLLADATGGKPAFTNAFQKLVRKVYPGSPLTDIPPTSALITGKFTGGVNVAHVTYRKFYVASHGQRHTPSLLGLKRGTRWVIVYSQADITSGLLGTHTWGILGYSPKSAQRLARNMILYAAGKH